MATPTRNRAVRLRRTLDSALAQSEVDLEVLVVDDGSTDGTSEALAARRDPRIREASGEWVALLDDDLRAPGKLASQLATPGRSGPGWSYTGYVMVDVQLNVLAGGPPPQEDVVHERMPHEDVIAAGASSIVARRSLLHAAGLFDERLTRMETWDLQIRPAEAAPAGGIPEPLVACCQHQAQVSLDVSILCGALDVIDGRYRPGRSPGCHDRTPRSSAVVPWSWPGCE